MSFQQRMKTAGEFELELIERLNEIGWQAFQFGQAQLPEECRSRLSRFEDGSRRPSRVRWMPDIITFRDQANGRSWIALIDAKESNPNMSNYSIEMSAMETCEIYTDQLYTPTFFVFSDYRVLTPMEVRQRGIPGPPPRKGFGSGTPYLLVPKNHARPFRDVFQASRIANENDTVGNAASRVIDKLGKGEDAA